MSQGLERMSLTRNTTLASLTAVAAQIAPGMSLPDVTDIAIQARAESAASWLESLFEFRNGKLQDDAWLEAARAGDTSLANALAWAARVWAEPRIAQVVEEVLAAPDGHFQAAGFSTDIVESKFVRLGVGETARKAASTLLNQAASVPLFEPTKFGPTIIGARRFLPTAQFVPVVVAFVSHRIRAQVGEPAASRADAVELALLWKVNAWFGLSKDEFRRASTPNPTHVGGSRAPLPQDLRLLHAEISRRKQVIVQGAPGTGKTYVAKKYVDWSTAGRGRESNLSEIVRSLPLNERSPRDVANAAIRMGLTAVWDIAQLHPSYGYEDFVRTLAPLVTPTGVTFQPEHRILSFIAAVGQEFQAIASTIDVILIVDEINRADIARVFGELLYALEYRDQPVRTPYEVEGDASMALPSNLVLLGTMNTADRSIALIDYALRRRFTFISLQPDRRVIEAAEWRGTRDRDAACRMFDAVATLFSVVDDNQSLAVGHSYFLPSVDAADEDESLRSLVRRFSFEVAPLLTEYAAEGLVDAKKVSSMLSSLGIVDSARQEEVEAALWRGLSNEESSMGPVDYSDREMPDGNGHPDQLVNDGTP